MQEEGKDWKALESEDSGSESTNEPISDLEQQNSFLLIYVDKSFFTGESKIIGMSGKKNKTLTPNVYFVIPYLLLFQTH